MTVARGDWTGLHRQAPAIGVLFFLLGTASLLQVSCRLESTTGPTSENSGGQTYPPSESAATASVIPTVFASNDGVPVMYSSLPPGQHLVYFNWRDHTLRLLAQDEGGQDLILAHTMASPTQDAAKIAYVDSGEIVAVDLVNGETTRAPLALKCYDPLSWAADGNRVAVECEDSIYIHTLVDASFVELTNSGEQSVDAFLSPVWAPNGQGVAYSYRQLTSLQPLAVDGIYVTEVNCLDAPTKCRELTQGPFLPYSTDVMKAWAPDSHSLAVFDETKAIRVIDLASNEIRLVADNIDLIDGLAWSPDGKWIAYSSNGDVYSIPSEGGEATLLASDRGYVVAWIEKDMDG